jgi:hypothetical protein
MNARHHAEDAIRQLSAFLTEIGDYPLPSFIANCHRKLEQIEELTSRARDDRDKLMDLCFRSCGAELDQSELFRHTRAKPFGYAGDFQIIDWILTSKADSSGTGRLWDEFYQKEHACLAVRYRAEFFFQLVARFAGNGQRISVLNLACGPCRDVIRVLETIPNPERMAFSCVDQDSHALAYARSLVGTAPERERACS